jgi:hypothetical protein
LDGSEVMETFRNTIAPVLTIRHVAQAVAFYERAFGDEGESRGFGFAGRLLRAWYTRGSRNASK